MSDLLREIQARVHGYWHDAPIPADELPKHRLVRETCELAKATGLTEAEIETWAITRQGVPTVAVVSADALRALQTRLNRPGGVGRFRARLERMRGGSDA